MAGPLNIIAMADPTIASLNGEGLDADRNRVRRAAPGKNYQFIPSYNSLNQLITMIRATLAANQDCLRTLEIYAHGNPVICNGIGLSDAAAFGAQLKTLNLCDVVDVYLSGCNTGVHFNGGPSIAQSLSQSAPTVGADNVQCTVYGSVGYLSGTSMEGNTNCKTDVTTGKGKGKRYFAPYPASQDGRQAGSTRAAGAACYRGFREGRPI